MNLNYHGLGPRGTKAIAIALVVSTPRGRRGPGGRRRVDEGAGQRFRGLLSRRLKRTPALVSAPLPVSPSRGDFPLAPGRTSLDTQTLKSRLFHIQKAKLQPAGPGKGAGLKLGPRVTVRVQSEMQTRVSTPKLTFARKDPLWSQSMHCLPFAAL